MLNTSFDILGRLTTALLFLVSLLLLNNCAPSPRMRPASTAGSANSTVQTETVPSQQTSVLHPPSMSESGMSPTGCDVNSSDGNSPDISADEDNSLDVSATDKRVQSLIDEALEFCQVAQEFWQKGELENALEALDQAYSLILKVETYEAPKLIQQKEDLRYLISKRILEIYASRNIVVNGNHAAIPLTINKHVQMEIDRFTTGPEKGFFLRSYKRSGLYRDRIVKELKEAGLPEELSWLPLIESGFMVNALSKARALGLWQFIPSTGYKFGLKRDLYIDERLDPEKATDAAIAYLKELHNIFGDWTTVLAAYNCGEGKVLRVIRSQNINYLDNFWDLYERLPYETARYVPRFLATIHIIKNAEKYGLNSVIPEPALEYETIQVNRQVHLKHIAKTVGITEKALKQLNPELRYNVLPPNEYSLNLPPGSAETILNAVASLPITHPPRRAFVYHRVRSGETLSTIAQRYGVSIRSICAANNIHRRNFIVAGKKIKIPQKGYSVYPASSTAASRTARPSKHIVKSGDSLWNLAKKYGTTVKKIQTLNNLRGTTLSIKQVLKIPGTEPERALGSELKKYQVKSGDSLYNIARNHGVKLSSLLKINNLTPHSTIYPGQTLYLE